METKEVSKQILENILLKLKLLKEIDELSKALGNVTMTLSTGAVGISLAYMPRGEEGDSFVTETGDRCIQYENDRSLKDCRCVVDGCNIHCVKYPNGLQASKYPRHVMNPAEIYDYMHAEHTPYSQMTPEEGRKHIIEKINAWSVYYYNINIRKCGQ